MQANNFRHQDYDRTPEAGQFELLHADQPKSVSDSNDGVAPNVLQRNKVAAIYLLHGTYTGDDILGIFRKVAALFPSLAVKLSRLEKRALDRLLRDVANYSEEFATQLALRANGNEQGPIPVKRFQWTGENNHVGRCDGAVQLLDELLQQAFAAGSRVQLWGHSHGGNVLALLTNLLGADLTARERFFDAAARFYSHLYRGHQQAWNRVRDALHAEGNPLADISLDVATFGTPIRYGWDLNAADHLLHFVNHRCADNLPVYQAALPRSLDDILSARFGDVIQQVAVAGTGVSPGIWSWRSRIANRRLRGLLQKGVRRRDLLHRLKLGKRVADAGTTLLVDYNQPKTSPLHLLAGHAVYTTIQWQEFHVEQVLRRCYQEPSSAKRSSNGN